MPPRLLVAALLAPAMCWRRYPGAAIAEPESAGSAEQLYSAGQHPPLVCTLVAAALPATKDAALSAWAAAAAPASAALEPATERAATSAAAVAAARAAQWATVGSRTSAAGPPLHAAPSLQRPPRRRLQVLACQLHWAAGSLAQASLRCSAAVTRGPEGSVTAARTAKVHRLQVPLAQNPVAPSLVCLGQQLRSSKACHSG
mmetsp:Transcript_104544/g.181561  ORF Transcript_104544/g.181561 Transcript_104544/m.181561 type:complete len:201 (-) Transcript_104544:129-731(-)